MVKQPVNKKPKKGKVVKKTKAKQIIARRAYTPTAIKQKVVVNVAAPSRRRGRPRKSESERRGPVAKGETILKTDMTPQYQFYDQQRASMPYIEEIKEDVKRLEAGRDSNEKRLLEMQKAGYQLLMQQEDLQKQLMNRPESRQLMGPVHLATPGKGRGGARAGAGRKPGSKNKPKEASALGPTIAEKLRSETANLRREIETQTEPIQPTPPPPPSTPPPAPAKSKSKKGGAKEEKGK